MREKIETVWMTWAVLGMVFLAAIKFIRQTGLGSTLLDIRIRWLPLILSAAVLLPSGCSRPSDAERESTIIEDIQTLDEQVSNVLISVGRIVSLRDCYMSAGPNLGLDELALRQCTVLLEHIRKIENSANYLSLTPEQTLQVDIAKWKAGDCSDIFIRFMDPDLFE